MTAGIVLTFSFLTSALLVVGAYLAVQDYVRSQSSKEEPSPLDLASTTAPDRFVAESWSERCQLWIDQSGMRLSPGVLALVCFVTACLSAAVSGLAVQRWWAAALAGVLTITAPLAILVLVRRQRVERLRRQLPDALDLMSRMLRAGQTIPQSLCGVAEEFDAPIADEFGYCYEQQNLGLSTDAAMYEMARRTGTLELRILVVALTVHRQTGGNLSELLDNLAGVIRERHRIQGQIRSLTADGRMQAAILLALPPLLFVTLTALNADYVTILYQFPWLMVGMFGFELLGAIWLHRIVSFDF